MARTSWKEDELRAIESVTDRPRDPWQIYEQWRAQSDIDLQSSKDPYESEANDRMIFIAKYILGKDMRFLINDTLYRLNDKDIKNLSNKQKAGFKVIGALVLEMLGHGVGAGVSLAAPVLGQTGNSADITRRIGDAISNVGGSGGRGLGNIAQTFDSSNVTTSQNVVDNAKRFAETITDAKRKAESGMDQQKRDEDSKEQNRSQTVRTLTSNT